MRTLSAALMVLTLSLCAGCIYSPEKLAVRVDPRAAVSARQPTDPEAGFGLDLGLLLSSGTYDFMGGSLVTLFTPERTRIGARYDWEISNLRRPHRDRAIIHLGALGFADLLEDEAVDGGLGGLAEFRYEFVFRDTMTHGLALFAAGQIEGHFVREDFDVWVSVGLGYTLYMNIR